MKDEEPFETFEPGENMKDEELFRTGITDAMEMDMETDNNDSNNNDPTRRDICCSLILLLWFISFYVALFMSTSLEDSVNWYLWTVMNVILCFFPVALCIFFVTCYDSSVNRIC